MAWCRREERWGRVSDGHDSKSKFGALNTQIMIYCIKIYMYDISK